MATEIITRQFLLTPAMGKRLIGRAMAAHPAVQAVLHAGTLVITAGTTNGYVAEEVLTSLGQAEGFSRRGFRRGMVAPPGFDTNAIKAASTADVVIADGAWQRGKDLFSVVDQMNSGDLVLKGANALDLRSRRAAVLIGHPMGGTVGATLPAVIGRRVRLIIPVGLEKRIDGNLDELAALLNGASTQGPRFMPVPGEVFTELDAIAMLTGAAGRLVAGGGILGAEGSAWIAASGNAGQLDAVEKLTTSLAGEPPCQA
jgi:hypothetical protein